MKSSEEYKVDMLAKPIIAPEVEDDVSEAYAWYKGGRAGLGEKFLGCVDACMDAICRTPEAYPIVHEQPWTYPAFSLFNLL